MSISRKHIEKAVAYYQVLMGIEHAVNIKWTVTSDEAEADVVSMPEYHKHTVSFNLDKLKTKKQVKAAVVHELAHVAISSYTQLAKALRVKGTRNALSDAEEALVTLIEKWPVWGGFKS